MYYTPSNTSQSGSYRNNIRLISTTYSQPSLSTTRLTLDKFLGVDFSSGKILSDIRRSSDAKNMIWGDNPYQAETRTGYKKIAETVIGDKINGLHTYLGSIIVHSGTNLYKVTETSDVYESTEIYTDITDTYSTSFVMNDNLYILGAGTYLQVNESFVVSPVEDVAYVPTTLMTATQSGAGTTYEAINLLTPYRKNLFYTITEQKTYEAVATASLTYTIPTTYDSDIIVDGLYFNVNVDGSVVTNYTMNYSTKVITFDSAPSLGAEIIVTYNTQQLRYYLDSQNIDWIKVEAEIDGETAVEDTDFTVNRTDGYIELTSAPTVTSTENVIVGFSNSSSRESIEEDFVSDGLTLDYTLSNTNIDNVVVLVGITEQTEGTDYTIDRFNGELSFTLAPTDLSEISVTYDRKYNGKASIINNCRFAGIFGGGNDTRVFVSGNAETKHTDYQSGLLDPTYFADTSYTEIGSDNSAIVGYVKQYNTQMIIKEGYNREDSSAFLRQFSIDSDGNIAFPVEQGAVGIGATSIRCFGDLQGEPLFLSNQGVIRVSGTNVDFHRLMKDASSTINTKLTKESNLSNACSIVYNDKYYLFVNGNVYIADARMRYTDSLSNVQYEWQYWTNINADSVAVFGDYLIFGYYGKIYRFKLKTEAGAYLDTIDDESTGIEAYWTTPALYFDNIAVRKNIDHIYMFVQEDVRVSIDIYASIDGGLFKEIELVSSNPSFNFADVIFSDIDFSTKDSLLTNKIRLNEKKFDNIQFRFYNNGETSSSVGIILFQIDYKLLKY